MLIEFLIVAVASFSVGFVLGGIYIHKKWMKPLPEFKNPHKVYDESGKGMNEAIDYLIKHSDE